MAPIVIHRGHKPEHYEELDQSKAGGEVELVQEEFREEDEGEDEPVPEEGDGAGGVVPLGLLESLVRRDQEAEQHLQQEVGLSHSTELHYSRGLEDPEQHLL